MEKEFYTPQEAAQAVIEKVKALTKSELAKAADPMAVKGAPKPANSTAVGAPSIPKAPSVPKMPKPMAKFVADRKAKLGKNNPDEGADAKLGEKVEKDVVDHIKENKSAEEKEGLIVGVK